ncbi:hypothetical protein BDV34DRAFT_213836 [Aspergillus parasiticus]|uniref:Altered inheritance of mitochondria protein 9, mitochondrial n=1 Tax=Aspergillus parasiticus TaxID=5067 RepID=A0A5N6DHI0_ASPPA|nr:hypothetical protein BDV34DRAFT_213836 [Aspergillus parasiticus]
MANIVGNPQDFFSYTKNWYGIISASCVSMAKIGEGLYNKSFKLTMALEITIMDFLRTILYLLVPKVLVWNYAVDSTNRVGAEYIIIEHAPGKNLADVWIDMDLELKSSYGCLFYRKDIPPGSYSVIVEGDNLSYELKHNIGEIFSIGPMVDTVFWSKGRGDIDIYQIYLIPQEQDILGSFLWHPDLLTSNIFVDNDSGHITSIIDWRAGPLFLEGCYPEFLDYSGDLVLELPGNFKQLDKNTQSAVKDKVTNSILLYFYENYTVERNPILSKNRDILPLRESLIRIQKKWDLLSRTVKCPIDFSSEEIRQHYEDGEGWNEVQDFWDALSGILSKDGWTSHATYNQALSIYSQIQAQTAPHSSYDVLPKEAYNGLSKYACSISSAEAVESSRERYYFPADPVST